MAETIFTGRERRRFVRVSSSLPVEFRITDNKDGEKSSKVYKAHARDISAGGLLMEIEALEAECQQRFRQGERKMEMSIALAEGAPPIRASGEALRLQGEGGLVYFFGVMFTSITENDKNALLQFIRKRLDEEKQET